MATATNKDYISKDLRKKNVDLPSIGIVAAIKKLVADPNTVAMKIVKRKMKNCAAVRRKPAMK